MKTKKLVVCAMLIALGSVLSVIQPFALPFGGGITLASMMPVCLIGMIYGMKTGVLSALC
ncbi:MAG: energy-coupled thiamine transporter ThiT, partial [Clostridia bacterium]|nr:energy-coupled thiamine transporter ThiT [Clostridia bacterium]